ncbi:MAG: esterase [Mycobacterium sp.]
MRILVVAVLLVGGWMGVPSAAAQSSCADLGGAVETGQMCHVHAATDSYTLDLRFPVDYADQRALTDYLVQNRDGFLTVAQMPGSRDRPYEMDATSEQHRSGQPSNGTQSVVLKIFQDVGGPHPSTWYKAFNYDLQPRQPITFDTLFASGSKPLDAIYPIVQRELGRQTGLPAALIPPGSGLDPSHYQNFAITDDDLIFYFAPGELLPLTAGATSARVPRNAIPPLAV